MGDLSPAELAELSTRLQALIDQARALQEQITQRSIEQRRADRPDHTGEPSAPAAKPGGRKRTPARTT
jgi:hypothetical protein